MAPGVVHALETVEVDEHGGDYAVAPRRAHQRQFQQARELAVIDQSGQAVVLGQARQLLRLLFQFRGALGHAVFERVVGGLQAVIDVVNDAVAAPQAPAGIGQQRQQQDRIRKQEAAVALAFEHLALEGTVEFAAQARHHLAGAERGDLGLDLVLARPVGQDDAGIARQRVDLVHHRLRKARLLVLDLGQAVLDAARQRRRGRQVVTQGIGQQVVQQCVQAHHHHSRRQRALDAAQLRLEVGQRRRQGLQGRAQEGVQGAELVHEVGLHAQRAGQLRMNLARAAPARHR